MVGSTFPYGEFLPKQGQAKRCRSTSIRRCSPALSDGRVADGRCGRDLKELLPLLKRKPRGPWRETVEKNVREWWSEEVARAHLPPSRSIRNVSSGNCRTHPGQRGLRRRYGDVDTFFARAVKMRRGMKTRFPEPWRRWARRCLLRRPRNSHIPDRPAFAFVGDGAMQMLGMNGAGNGGEILEALARSAPGRSRSSTTATSTWSDGSCAPWAACPKVAATQELPDIDYRLCRTARTERVDGGRAERCGWVWDEALRRTGRW